MHYIILVTCLIMAQVSSDDFINVNKLRYLEQTETHCIIRQYYNPHEIKSTWTCGRVEESIIDSIKAGCNNS